MLFPIYLSLCAVSNTLFGLHLIRRGRDKIKWMDSMGEDYEFYRRKSLFYQAEIGYHDFEDWLVWKISERREARRLARKKTELMQLRKRIRERTLLRRAKRMQLEEKARQMTDMVDSLGNEIGTLWTASTFGAAIPMFIALAISVLVAQVGSLEVSLATFMVSVCAGLAVSSYLTDHAIDKFSKNADISADIIGRVLHEQEENVAKKPVKVQRSQISKNRRAYSSTVDAELRMVKNKKNHKQKGRS